jgi:hypothetical protein
MESPVVPYNHRAFLYIQYRGNVMSTSRKERSKNSFTQAAWDQCGDISYYHNVAIAIRLLPTKRRGVFLIEVGAFRQEQGAKMRRVAKYAVEWPNASNDDLGAALWAAVNQVDRLLLEDNPHKPTKELWRQEVEAAAD